MSKKVNLVIAIQQLTDEQLVSSIKKYTGLISAYNRYIMLAKRELKHRKRAEKQLTDLQTKGINVNE